MSIAHVQSTGNRDDAAGTTIVKAFVSNVTAGNTIVVIAFCGTGVAISGITDSLGNTYTERVSGISGRLKVYEAPNITGGACTVTVTFSDSVPYRAMSIHEYSGMVNTGAFDVGAGATASRAGSSATDGNYTDNITTTANGDLIIGAIINIPASWVAVAPGTGLTERYDDGPNGWYESEDKVQASSGSTNATWTCDNTDAYYWIIASFKAATALVSITPPAGSLSASGIASRNDFGIFVPTEVDA